MKICREYLPRLSRKGRIVRNLVTVLVLLLFIWALRDFAPPTVALAVRWRAEEYGLAAPEILYCSEWERDRADLLLRWEDGRLASSRCYRWLGSRSVGEFCFAQPEDGGAVLFQAQTGTPADTVYFWADEPEAARAECRLRLRSDIQASWTDESAGTSASDHFDWDETYVMEAVPSPQGIYCFPITLKYPNEENEAALRTRAMAEESALRSYNNIRRRVVGTDFAAELSVTFYDAAGQVLGTWEQELWNSFPGGADR